MIQGTYHLDGSHNDPGVNMPAGALSGTAYSVQEAGWGGVTNEHFKIHRIIASQDNVGAMNRRDAKAIDKKMDDGAPRSGNVMSRVGVYTTESAYTEACRSFYPLSTDGIDDCILVFDYIK